MAQGATSRLGLYSVLQVSEEATYGTYETDGSSFPFRSENMKLMREKKVIESINSTRERQQVFQANETVEGSIEADFNPAETGIAYLIKQCFGGTVSSAIVSTGNYLHTFMPGNMDNNDSTVGSADAKALSIYVQRGETSTGGWGFSGCRVNQMTVKGEIGQPVNISFELIGQTASLTAHVVTPGYSTILPLIFNGVTLQEGASVGSFPVTADIFQNFEVVFQNNLQSDEKARQLGSRQLSVLPPGMRAVSVKLGQRFDTTTAFTKFTANTFSALRILMDSGVTVGSAQGNTTYSAYIDLFRVYWEDCMPEASDAGILSQEQKGIAISDSAAGVSIRMVLSNATTGY